MLARNDVSRLNQRPVKAAYHDPVAAEPGETLLPEVTVEVPGGTVLRRGTCCERRRGRLGTQYEMYFKI